MFSDLSLYSMTGLILILVAFSYACQQVFSHLIRQRSLSRQYSLKNDLLSERLKALRRQGIGGAQSNATGWKGFANFVVVNKYVHQGSGVCSFYLKPADDRIELVGFEPGQHLIFQLPASAATQNAPLTRRYSLSDAPGKDCYRISVKHAKAPRGKPHLPDGLGSSFFHQEVEAEGAMPSRSHLLVSKPTGSFVLDQHARQPVVLIAGGVGITPLLSMFNSIVRENETREVWLICGVRNSEEDILMDDGMLDEKFFEIRETHPNLHIQMFYSAPSDSDIARRAEGELAYHTGRIGLAGLQEILPCNNYHYYICAAEVMMDAVEECLILWGVSEDHIFSERFAPPKKLKSQQTVEGVVRFERSNKEMEFPDGVGTLLDLAEKEGVPVQSDCRTGACGACEVSIISGKVKYLQKTNYKCPPGACLACSCVPDGKLVIDC